MRAIRIGIVKLVRLAYEAGRLDRLFLGRYRARARQIPTLERVDPLSTCAVRINAVNAPLGIEVLGLDLVAALDALTRHSIEEALGVRSVPETLRMAGRNYGLGGLHPVWRVLVPAALPAILSRLKRGRAFAWRTLIAAERVFGASSANGLGWYIFPNRNELHSDEVFAGLALVMLICLVVENLMFHRLERATRPCLSMQRCIVKALVSAFVCRAKRRHPWLHGRRRFALRMSHVDIFNA